MRSIAAPAWLRAATASAVSHSIAASSSSPPSSPTSPKMRVSGAKRRSVRCCRSVASRTSTKRWPAPMTRSLGLARRSLPATSSGLSRASTALMPATPGSIPFRSPTMSCPLAGPSTVALARSTAWRCSTSIPSKRASSWRASSVRTALPSPGRPSNTRSGRCGPLRRLGDVIQHPAELASGHCGLAVGADAGLVDGDRRAAVRTLRDFGGLPHPRPRRLAADERPELGKRLDRLIATEHLAGVIHFVIFGDGVEPDRDTVKVRVARDLGDGAAIDGQVFEHVALVQGHKLLDLQLPAVINRVGEIDAGRLKVAGHPGILQHEEGGLGPVDEDLRVEVRIAGLQGGYAALNRRRLDAGAGRQSGIIAGSAAPGLPARQSAVDEEGADEGQDDEEEQRRPAARAARAATADEDKAATRAAAAAPAAVTATPTPTAAAPGAGQRGELDGEGERPRGPECDQNAPPLSHGDAYNRSARPSLRGGRSLWRH